MNAAQSGDERKLQNVLRQLLEVLLFIFNLHFADGNWDGVTVGDSLRVEMLRCPCIGCRREKTSSRRESSVRDLRTKSMTLG
jgi:hypothetical protein